LWGVGKHTRGVCDAWNMFLSLCNTSRTAHIAPSATQTCPSPTSLCQVCRACTDVRGTLRAGHLICGRCCPCALQDACLHHNQGPDQHWVALPNSDEPPRVWNAAHFWAQAMPHRCVMPPSLRSKRKNNHNQGPDQHWRLAGSGSKSAAEWQQSVSPTKPCQQGHTPAGPAQQQGSSLPARYMHWQRADGHRRAYSCSGFRHGDYCSREGPGTQCSWPFLSS
jgi:hypothetical protein